MSEDERSLSGHGTRGAGEDTLAMTMLNALQHPVVLVDSDHTILGANEAAQNFLQSSAAMLARYKIDYFMPFGSPVISLIDQVVAQGSPFTKYRVDISSPRLGSEKIVDVYAAPTNDKSNSVVIMLMEKGMAEKLDRQLIHRGAARSVTGLASMLAHEIKNPLSGIRGAAQLLELSADDNDRALTRLITDEADRIVKLVDRMEVFSDERQIEREPVNIHDVLEYVKRLAHSGFGRDVRFSEEYDPSLPPVYANRDQLVQVFLNLVKNAAEALVDTSEPEIVLTTSFRPGVRLSVPGVRDKVSLPLEFCVRDNGPGVPEDLVPHLFDPFVTTKTNGTGLGLALVAKIVGDHGGVVECDSQPRRTTFRVLMPAFKD